jgi:hypothetical protein
MCLACELDALWYAEWERLAADGANLPGTAGVPPAVPGEPVSAPGSALGAAGVSPAVFDAPGGVEGGAASAALTAWIRGETESAGGTSEVAATSTVPGNAGATSAVPGRPARPGAPRSGFRCEETE